MEKTDKIFIPKNVAPHLTEEWASLAHGNFEEYIRKGALLKWAKEMKEQAARRPHRNPADGIQCLGKQQAFDALIGKLNTM